MDTINFSTKRGTSYYIDEDRENLKYLLRKWPKSFSVVHIRSHSTGKPKTVSVNWIEENIADKDYDEIRHLYTY